MGFESVRFFNFRNLRDRELSLGAKEVFLIGENGQGKTNLIEAIYLLSVASSFRENRDSVMFRDSQAEMGLSGRYTDPMGGVKVVDLRVRTGMKKEIRVDGRPLIDRRELIGQVLCICFVQQDMDFVAGTPEARRRFFDQTLVLSTPAFIETLRAYRKVLKARNFVLKQRREELLDAYDKQLAAFGLELTAGRASLVRRFNTVFSPLFKDIMGVETPVEIRYAPSWRETSSAAEAEELLAAMRGRDLAFGASTAGPHRDLFQFSCDGRDFAAYASTGQMRLCALVLRVAQAAFLAERTGKKPVLLLDDVLLELDPAKKRAFISRLPESEQAFFTFLPDENYLPYRGDATLLLAVENGDFRAG
jgi:DNA replication and repair protein RecF